MSDKKYVAISEPNSNGIAQYVSVNIGDIQTYINNMEEKGYEEEYYPYISIGYRNTNSTKEFPNIDIEIYLSGAITVYDDMSFIRHFKNDPGKILEIYNHMVLLTNAASYSMNYEDVFITISNKIFEILKEWVHPLDVSDMIEDRKILNLCNKTLSEEKYNSTFMVDLEKVDDNLYYNRNVFSKIEIIPSSPLLWLRKTVGTFSMEFIIYPDGSLFVKDFPTWQHFDDIKKFGGDEILKFCKECSSYYKSIDGDFSKEDYEKYSLLVRRLIWSISTVRVYCDCEVKYDE